MINIAREQYSFLSPLKHDVRIDSAAQFQADYQAEKDEKTFDNVAPYHSVYYRLRKYGLSGNGDELIAKVKAYLGEAEYSYYDVLSPGENIIVAITRGGYVKRLTSVR